MKKIGRLKKQIEIAEIINDYVDKMTPFNSEFNENWLKINDAYMNLLKNKHIVKNEIVNTLKDNITSLEYLSDNMYTAKSQFESLLDIIQNSKGIESKLNQACNRLIEQIQIYIDNLETAMISIERINERTKFINIINQFICGIWIFKLICNILH